MAVEVSAGKSRRRLWVGRNVKEPMFAGRRTEGHHWGMAASCLKISIQHNPLDCKVKK
jgi:hypothetical protein